MTDPAELAQRMDQQEEKLDQLEAKIAAAADELAELKADTSVLEERIGLVEDGLSARGQVGAPGGGGQYAPDDTTNAVIDHVLSWAETENVRTVPLGRLHKSVEREGYTRKQELKKYSKRAVRHGPFKPHPEVTSAWVVDPDAADIEIEPEGAQA